MIDVKNAINQTVLNSYDVGVTNERARAKIFTDSILFGLKKQFEEATGTRKDLYTAIIFSIEALQTGLEEDAVEWDANVKKALNEA